ncbi:hypothetical protein MXB_511, partial [Myxobolus squamalis]
MSESIKASPNLTFAENLVLSGTAAIISKTAAAPIERLKLILQNQDEMIKQKRLDVHYKGIIDCTKRVAASEGYLSFWRGNGANVLRYFPTQALNFAFLGKIKENFGPKEEDSTKKMFTKNIISGGLAGSMSLVFVYSLDYARTRLASDAKMGGKIGGARQFNGLIDVYVKTFSSEGIRGLYRGFCISCFGVFVYRGIYFGLYDSVKPLLGSDKLNLAVSFSIAYMVTILAGFVAYPLDTIRRRMMMTSLSENPYKYSFQCANSIIKNETWQALFKGAGAN